MTEKKSENDLGKGKKVSTFYIAMTAVFVALAFVATFVIQIPVGIGYVNFGDAVVMTAAVVLGPLGGAIVGGLGPALADVATGFVVYAPFTLAIKALEGFVCGLIMKKVLPSKNSYLRALIAFAVSGVIVIAGYFFADFLLVLFGVISENGQSMYAAWVAGAATLLGSLVQVGVSIAIALIVSPKLPTLQFIRAGKND